MGSKLNVKSNQEAFDAVCRHAAGMERKSVNGDGDCMYRSPYGGKCFVGCLIPDDEYDRDMEYNYPPNFRLSGGIVSCELLKRLQAIHDHKPRESWPECLRQEAVIYDLYDSAVDQVGESWSVK